MLALALFVCSIAVADSLNPSTVGPALYLATGPDARRGLAGFIVGVFGVSTLGGLVLTLGPGRALLAAVPHPGPHAKHLAELALGFAVLLVAAVLWAMRERVARKVIRAEERGARNSLLLGAGIMAVELPTALPYFAVIGAIIADGGNALSQIVLLLVFNGVFVAPLLAILAIRSLARQRGIDALAAFRLRLNQRAAVVIPAVAFLAAAALLVLGSAGLATD